MQELNDPEFRFLPGADYTSAYAEGGEVGGRIMVKQEVDSNDQ